jgi:hypothetical protein
MMGVKLENDIFGTTPSLKSKSKIGQLFDVFSSAEFLIVSKNWPVSIDLLS